MNFKMIQLSRTGSGSELLSLLWDVGHEQELATVHIFVREKCGRIA